MAVQAVARQTVAQAYRRARPLTLARQHVEPQRVGTFRDFVSRIKPGYQWYEHCERLGNVLQRVADDKIRRLMIFAPPRHGKSEEVSRLFSAYYLLRHPNRWVGINSYAADLAYTLSRSSRENYAAGGGATKPDAGAVKHWETMGGGGLWAAGVGGPITGKGFHLGIIDDPLKNAEEAASALIREKQKEWYRSTFYTREEPGGAIVVIQTRWHEDDLSGWLLSEEIGEDTDTPEGWHVVNFEALKERDRQPFPPSVTLERDWRKPGEPLCPERYPTAKLDKIRSRIGGYVFGALYQQHPTPREGAFFKVNNLQIIDAPPAGLRLCRAWDLAATAAGGDYTAGVLMGTDDDGRFYVLDVARGQWGTDERNAAMRQTAALDPKGTRVRLAQDPGQAGKDQAKSLTGMLAGHSVKALRVSGPKEARADPFSAQVNAGNVSLVRNDAWNRAFIEELRSFPLGKHDDQIDASSDAFAELAVPVKAETDPNLYRRLFPSDEQR